MNGMESKKTAASVICALVMFAWIGAARLTQAAEFVTLPNGEEVMDIRGNWDAEFENYGPWSQYGSYPGTIEIILDGNTFVGKRLTATKYHAADTECFRCELDSSGITKLQLMTRLGPIEAKGQLGNDGKRLTFDDGEKTRSTMTKQ